MCVSYRLLFSVVSVSSGFSEASEGVEVVDWESSSVSLRLLLCRSSESGTSFFDATVRFYLNIYKVVLFGFIRKCSLDC